MNHDTRRPTTDGPPIWQVRCPRGCGAASPWTTELAGQTWLAGHRCEEVAPS